VTDLVIIKSENTIGGRFVDPLKPSKRKSSKLGTTVQT